MVQEFHVVRCFSCLSFQSQQVCKKPKYTCKICGEKQSVRKEYGRGSGKDCRIHVQKLNSLQGNLEVEHERRLEVQLEKQVYDKQLAKTSSGYHNRCNEYTDEMKDSTVYAEDSTINFPGNSDKGHTTEKAVGHKSKSKWATFLANVEINNTEYEDHSCASTR
ncbi:MRN complex-interacting protein isoform X1 [Macrobrachium rosenbergii]|uniref:MRN complex-interacting protein isoform X1 n=1 Tax=Macrobrachium rosenbergii TaxID=79674 RepID=UPI0034D40C0B